MGSSTTGPMTPHNSNKKRLFSSSDNNGHPNPKNKILKQNEGVFNSSTEVGETMEVDLDNGLSVSDSSSDKSESEEEYAVLQTGFDNVDVPTGIEASFPQFLGDDKMKSEMKGDVELASSSKASGSSSQRLKRCGKKVESVKRLVKTRRQKGSSGLVISSSSNRQDQFECATNHGQVVPMEDETVVQDSDNNDEVLRKYKNFKRFDIVEDFSDHHYARSSSAMMEPPKNWAKKIQEEWKILEKNLPDMIFVRVYESRMDLLRAVIVGAEGTPYHDGLFFFDVCFPEKYPYEPPQVHYHSGGLRINPNLYNSGKVCLSLLNTWVGYKNEIWTPGVSNIFQVLLSIQALILNEKPYYNEPGYERTRGSTQGENRSLQYSERILVLSLKTMVYTMKKPPKHFEDLVVGHFSDRARGILTICKAYHTKGIRVGCGVDDDVETSSRRFGNDVKGYMKTLVGAFKQIGVDNLEEEFVPPTQNLTQKIWAFFGF